MFQSTYLSPSKFSLEFHFRNSKVKNSIADRTEILNCAWLNWWTSEWGGVYILLKWNWIQAAGNSISLDYMGVDYCRATRNRRGAIGFVLHTTLLTQVRLYRYTRTLLRKKMSLVRLSLCYLSQNKSDFLTFQSGLHFVDRVMETVAVPLQYSCGDDYRIDSLIVIFFFP
jgi:hypothetical protein